MRPRRRRNIPLPVISSTAASAFLGRKLDNWDWLKAAPREELREHVRRLGHRFTADPWHNQLVAFSIAHVMPHFVFAMDMGGGKSSIALQQVRYRKRRGELSRAIVVVPYLMHVEGWEEQLRVDAPDLNYRLLVGDRNERAALLRRPSDICIINHGGLQAMMTRLVEKKRKKKREYAIDVTAAGEFASLFNFLAIDECHYFGNPRSLYFDMAWWLSCACAYRYLFSGTLFGRDPTALFPQFRLCDHGETLGERLGLFRSVFFTPKKHYWKGVDWTFDESMTPELHRVVKHRSISYDIEELHDLPPRLSIKVPVHLRGEGKEFYERILEGVKEVRGDYRSLEAVYVRMRQCASGFIAMQSDEDRIEVRFRENPKLEALHDFVLSRDEKMLVFHNFRPSGRFIEEMLEGARMKFASLRGGMKDPGAEYSRFLREDSCRIFVLNNKLGSENINPQYVARRACFYESPDSSKQRAQAERRVWRPGQRWKVFLHDFVVRGTIEEKILRYNAEGRDLLKAVMSGGDSFHLHQQEE